LNVATMYVGSQFSYSTRSRVAVQPSRNAFSQKSNFI